MPEAAPPFDGEPRPGLTPLASRPLPVPAPPSAADPPDDWPRRFAVILTEAIAGARPHRHLTPLMTERSVAHLRRVLAAFAGGQPRILRVLTTRPAPDVAETTVIVDCGQRARALALRFERASGGRWLCTDVEGG